MGKILSRRVRARSLLRCQDLRKKKKKTEEMREENWASLDPFPLKNR